MERSPLKMRACHEYRCARPLESAVMASTNCGAMRHQQYDVAAIRPGIYLHYGKGYLVMKMRLGF